MAFQNHFTAKKLPADASREQRADEQAALILLRILENVVQEIKSANPKALIRVEGSCMQDLFLQTQGLNSEEMAELKFRTGLHPHPLVKAEKTA